MHGHAHLQAPRHPRCVLQLERAPHRTGYLAPLAQQQILLTSIGPDLSPRGGQKPCWPPFHPLSLSPLQGEGRRSRRRVWGGGRLQGSHLPCWGAFQCSVHLGCRVLCHRLGLGLVSCRHWLLSSIPRPPGEALTQGLSCSAQRGSPVAALSQQWTELGINTLGLLDSQVGQSGV